MGVSSITSRASAGDGRHWPAGAGPPPRRARFLAFAAASSSAWHTSLRDFAVSRRARSSTNDADRLRKYLARFGLTFERASGRPERSPAGPPA
ncbi:MAG TPA: hypothetical protein VF530_17650 [Planctomycetota bacterium]